MPENITTVLNLPAADFGSGVFSNPADNRVYILQGAGSDRDRKVSLGLGGCHHRADIRRARAEERY